MKPIHLLPFLSLLLLLTPSSGNAAGSMLRIICDGDDVGAEVLLNGEFRGECPIDLQVPKGSLKLLVRKKADGGRERVFEQEIRMGEGSVKKVEARLGAAKLNAGEAARRVENNRRLRAMPLAALQKEAEVGNTEAMVIIAGAYKRGANGAPVNKELGDTWWQKAAEAGNVEAMTLVGSKSLSGDGFLKDPIQGMIFLRRAAEAGSARAMYRIAMAYETGQAGLQKNDAEALQWYRRAAENGDTSSMSLLAFYYYIGRGVPKDMEVSIDWVRKGAEAGDTGAMNTLGKRYSEGDGVMANEQQAIYWWRKAAEGEDPEPEAVNELKKRGLR